jgi:hypothetical protein
VASSQAPTAGNAGSHTGDQPAPGETIEHRLYFKPSHAEFVLSAIDVEGWTDQQPVAVVALIEQAAATLGARHYALAELRKAAAEAVAVVQARVDAARQNGDLKQVNRQYKMYRFAQVAKGEKAITYAAHLTAFTRSLLEKVARSSQ